MMETDLTTVHIFKTNIREIKPGCVMKETLNNHAAVKQWSIDHEDVDCVLRVVSETLKPKAIIELINAFGHECQELL